MDKQSFLSGIAIGMAVSDGSMSTADILKLMVDDSPEPKINQLDIILKMAQRMATDSPIVSKPVISDEVIPVKSVSEKPPADGNYNELFTPQELAAMGMQSKDVKDATTGFEVPRSENATTSQSSGGVTYPVKETESLGNALEIEFDLSPDVLEQKKEEAAANEIVGQLSKMFDIEL